MDAQALRRDAWGAVLALAFIIAVAAAALSSLLALLEMATGLVMDLGVGRRPAVLAVGGAALPAGLPSAWSLEVFDNQDWVWGRGLLVAGAFFAGAVLRRGARRFRAEHLLTGRRAGSTRPLGGSREPRGGRSRPGGAGRSGSLAGPRCRTWPYLASLSFSALVFSCSEFSWMNARMSSERLSSFSHCSRYSVTGNRPIP